MTFGSLFAGIGGFELALTSLGMELKFMVEIDPFCQKVLAKNFPGVPIYNDITKIKWIVADTNGNGEKRNKSEYGEWRGTSEGDCDATDPKSEQAIPSESGGLHPESCVQVRTSRIDLLTGGFPCQPFSCAGKRKGNQDDRFLWPEMLRAIHEIKPRWVIAENVPGLLTIDNGMVFEGVLSDLENEGYEVIPFVIPACAKGAPHRRDRVWICSHLENSKGKRLEGWGNGAGWQSEKRMRLFSPGSDCHAADSEGGGWGEGNSNSGRTRQREGTQDQWRGFTNENRWCESWYEVATRFCGVFNGLSYFLDRSGGLNAEISKRITGQDLPHLWEGVQSESFQWCSGRFNEVSFKENLFTVMWKYFAKSYRQDNLSFESQEVQEAYLRNVWEENRSRHSPQRWEYQEQYFREHFDSLSFLSHEIALDTEKRVKAFGKNRVDRLKSLGNAVVPQIVYQIGRAIMEVEQKELFGG